MLRKVLVVAALAALLAPPAFAQSRVEVGGLFGWTFSEGVDITGTAVNGGVYSRVDPASSVSYGFTFGVHATPEVEIEFLYSRQPTQIEVSGTGPLIKGDISLSNYHGNFVYNIGDPEKTMRPFVFVGIGATSYSDATFPTKTIAGLTRFSWAMGGGIKAYPSKHVGFKAMARWTPTYIKTDVYGWWCDPFWGCGPVGSPKYSNQLEMSGSLMVRF